MPAEPNSPNSSAPTRIDARYWGASPPGDSSSAPAAPRLSSKPSPKLGDRRGSSHLCIADHLRTPGRHGDRLRPRRHGVDGRGRFDRRYRAHRGDQSSHLADQPLAVGSDAPLVQQARVPRRRHGETALRRRASAYPPGGRRVPVHRAEDRLHPRPEPDRLHLWAVAIKRPHRGHARHLRVPERGRAARRRGARARPHRQSRFHPDDHGGHAGADPLPGLRGAHAEQRRQQRQEGQRGHHRSGGAPLLLYRHLPAALSQPDTRISRRRLFSLP